MTVKNPWLNDGSKAISFWAAKYKTTFNEDPTVFSAHGYNAIDAFAATKRVGSDASRLSQRQHAGKSHPTTSSRNERPSRTV